MRIINPAHFRLSKMLRFEVSYEVLFSEIPKPDGIIGSGTHNYYCMVGGGGGLLFCITSLMRSDSSSKCSDVYNFISLYHVVALLICIKLLYWA